MGTTNQNEPSSVEQHHATSPERLRCAVITVSDTRTLENDTGGAAVIEHLEKAGHAVVQREIIRDEPAVMRPLLESLGGRNDVDAILLTGGTGIASRDQTYETVTALLTKPLPGYGELFRMLSFQEIGAAAMLSRATGGLMGKKVVLTMPGSPAGVKLAMEKLIVPELGHLVREARR
jgi:molybdenum cofactor biosynthesis protein B